MFMYHSTIWYLISGDAQLSIAISFRVSPTTVSRIIQETCGVIWDELCRRGYLDVPDTEYKWKKIAKEFELRWNFPRCLGTLMGNILLCRSRLPVPLNTSITKRHIA